MHPDVIPGCIPGVVRDIEDPEAGSRIRVELPGLLAITPYWVMPMGWPGAGGEGKGSHYPPPPLGGQVIVMFEWGKWRDADSHAFYFTGYYGLKDGVPAGPPSVYEGTMPQSPRERVCFWESDDFVFYAVDEPNLKKISMEAKATGSKIEINAADGASGKAETITIEGRTMISLYSKGIIDISADCGVQIQGRRVSAHKRDWI